VSPPSVFVLGAGRSGTSILQSLLSMHGRLVISHELRVLELAVLTGALIDNAGSPALDEKAPKSVFGLELGKAYVALLGAEQLRAAGKSGGVYGDKYPPYCDQLAHLERLWPAAKFVHIVRDGRDVVASALQAYVVDRGWRRSAETPSVRAIATSWARQVRSARAYGASLQAARYHELRYEQLCVDAAGVLASVLRFLGLALDDKHAEMAKRMRPGRNWRETLARDELDEFEACVEARTLNLELGYEPTPTEPQARRGLGPDDWAQLGRELGGSKSMACFVRGMRTPSKSLEAIRGALALPSRPESLFAALNARSLDDPAAREALADWMQARGLDAQAARAVVGLAGEARV
jgi:hypothetical protein